MATGIIADHSTSTEFVWEVCDNVDTKNVCQHEAPDGAPDDWAPDHRVYTYGYDSTLKAVATDNKPLDAAGQKKNAFAGLKALLAPVPAPPPAASAPELPALTGLV